jgi:ERCC4-related helicase
MVNDLTRGACPASDIKCLVIDEAHKALGNYAYCQVRILLNGVILMGTHIVKGHFGG